MSDITFDTTGLESYMPNSDLESEYGVWIKFPGGRRFRCLRAGGTNHRFTRAFQTAIKPHRRQMDRGTLDAEVSEEILQRCYAKHVVIDWDGIKDSAGADVPYSPEHGEAYFKAVPELFNDLLNLCTEASTFVEQQAEEAAEVLGEDSSGTSSGPKT